MVNKYDKDQPITNWAPVVGQWKIETEKVAYLGQRPAQQTAPTPYGICVSDVRLTEGEAKVAIRFPADFDGIGDAVAHDASACLLFGYRSPREEYINVGLGEYRTAYSISRLEPGGTWRAVAAVGNKENLIPDRNYKLHVCIQGQRVVVEVDGVRVLEHVLDTPLPNGQLGLFGFGTGTVEFTRPSVSLEHGTVFVAMEFSEPYHELYREVIEKTAWDNGLVARHAGEVSGPGIILQDIIKGIETAKIVIAEITPPNPNVFYELGYAHALRKPTILLADRAKLEKLPFDISGYRCLFYENSIGGKRKVEEALTKHLMLIRLFQHTTICWGLGLKRQVRKVQRIADAVVRGRDACGSEAKESLEGSHGLFSAIVPKDELVEVGLELRAADPVMSADEQLLEVADGAIGEWHHRRRTFAQFGSQRLSARDVLEAEFLQASKAFEAIGMNGRARSDVLRDEAVDRRRPEVWDDCHTGTPRRSSALLNGYHDECRAAPPELAAPADPGLGAANPGVVDFDLAVKRLARRIHRRSPELVQYHPSGFVTLKTKLVLEKQRRDASLVGRHQVGRPEPEGQRGIVKDCPRCQGDLVTT